VDRMDQGAVAAVVAATKFADESPFPDSDELYTDVYLSYPEGHFSRG